MQRSHCFLAAMLLLLAGCSGMSPAGATPTAIIPTTTPTVSPTATIAPVPDSTPTLRVEVSRVCSPLAGIALEELTGLIVNDYNPPRLGSDDPHQGIDLAVLSAPGGIALSGATIQAMMTGKVAGLANDRFPYGNMLMVEVPLAELPTTVLDPALIPTPLPERLPPGALTCPDLNIQPAASGAARSLYILYAHMQNPVELKIGDSVGCGQVVGAIGDSGNALNPHLHVEVRVGPAGQTFPSMAHYDPSATYEEMAGYCTWRVSGVYQTINPTCLWGDCQ